MSVIQTKNLRKYYGKSIKAVDDISISVREGEIYGVIGPNGAGKTSLIKTIVGILTPTSGKLSVLEKNPRESKAFIRKNIGYMPQTLALYDDLTATETLQFFGSLQRVENIKSRIDEVLTLLELNERKNSLVHTFSGGMKKKLSLACALLHKPQLLILDEPTAAIDPLLRETIWDSFRQLAKNGVTIVMTTHSMDEAIKCDRIALLQKGSLLLETDPKELLKRKTKSDETLEDIVIRLIKESQKI